MSCSHKSPDNITVKRYRRRDKCGPDHDIKHGNCPLCLVEISNSGSWQGWTTVEEMTKRTAGWNTCIHPIEYTENYDIQLKTWKRIYSKKEDDCPVCKAHVKLSEFGEWILAT